MGHRKPLLTVMWLIGALLCMDYANAEPYLAVQQGLKCMQCHVNPSGGGQRTVFGEVFAQNVMPSKHIDTGDQVWTGALNAFVSIGGDLRANGEWRKMRGQPALSQFNLDQTRVYLNATVIPERLLVYVDELLAPDGAINREAWGQLWSTNKTWYVKAGQMYLPFGFRLEDQQAYTRQIAGINMHTPDTGVEFGFERGPWDAQLAISNGASGGIEANNGKQFTTQLIYVANRWRAGAAYSLNDTSGGQIRAAAVFAGLRTGPISWLAELDKVQLPQPNQLHTSLAAALLEANWLIARGHNLKITTEWFDPDTDQSQDARQRWSVVYEHAPIQFLQFRLGFRKDSADIAIDALHQQQAFAQLHAFF